MSKEVKKEKTAVAQIRERHFERKQQRKPPSKDILDLFKKNESKDKPADAPLKKIAKRRPPEAGL